MTIYRFRLRRVIVCLCLLIAGPFSACSPTTEQPPGFTEPSDPCADLVCDAGENCIEGVCIVSETSDPCANLSCGDGKVCIDGACLDVSSCLSPSNDGFNVDLALELEDLVRIATQHFNAGSGGDPWNAANPCWKLVEYIESPSSILPPSTEAMIARNIATGDLAVAFPGSHGTADWIINLADIPDDWTLHGTCNNIEEEIVIPDAVHKGFHIAYDAIHDDLWEALTAALPEPDNQATARVYFSGHSLGGALATLASLRMVNDLVAEGYNRDNVIMYSFAAPRSILDILYDEYSCLVPNAYAIVNLQDFVPRKVWITFHGTYTHIEKTVVLASQGAGTQKVTRLSHGPGNEFGGCVNAPIRFNLHARATYRTRLEAVQPSQEPNPAISVAAGLLVIGYAGGVTEKCDKIAVYRGNPSNPANLLNGTVRLVTDLDGLCDIPSLDQCFITTVPRYANYHVAYFDGFDRLLKIKEYVPSTPELRLDSVGPFLRVRWEVRDPGSKDFIAFYDHNPSNGDPDDFIGAARIDISSKVLVFPRGNSGSHISAVTGSGKWVAYVMRDGAAGSSRSRILAKKGPS